jgi:hypothetical protein
MAKMAKEIIGTPEAPQAIGPYSQAVRYGGLVYCSGQIPLDPATGQLVAGDIAVHPLGGPTTWTAHAHRDVTLSELPAPTGVDAPRTETAPRREAAMRPVSQRSSPFSPAP